MTETESEQVQEALKKLRERMPDYFKCFQSPWHLVGDTLRYFVDDEEIKVSEWGHVRNLFAIAQSLNAALDAEIARREAAEKIIQNQKDFERSCGFTCGHPFLPVGFEDGTWHCAECWANKAEARVVEMTKDIEQGFMAGAYARLKNLQDTEKALADLRQAIREIKI